MIKAQRVGRRRMAPVCAVAACAAGVLSLSGCVAGSAQPISASPVVASSPASAAASSAPATPSQAANASVTPVPPPTQAPSTAAGAAPVLGAAFNPATGGYGTAKPSEINNGGDPTGIVASITWSSWGGATATGTGTSTYVANGESVAQGTQQTATVVAFDLGSCNGKPAYLKVEWYFAGKGQSFNANAYINACTGDHVGGF